MDKLGIEGKKTYAFVQIKRKKCVYFDKENMRTKYYDFTRLCDWVIIVYCNTTKCNMGTFLRFRFGFALLSDEAAVYKEPWEMFGCSLYKFSAGPVSRNKEK